MLEVLFNVLSDRGVKSACSIMSLFARRRLLANFRIEYSLPSAFDSSSTIWHQGLNRTNTARDCVRIIVVISSPVSSSTSEYFSHCFTWWYLGILYLTGVGFFLLFIIFWTACTLAQLSSHSACMKYSMTGYVCIILSHLQCLVSVVRWSSFGKSNFSESIIEFERITWKCVGQTCVLYGMYCKNTKNCKRYRALLQHFFLLREKKPYLRWEKVIFWVFCFKLFVV